MDLGAFSVSLSVKDLEASRQFYEKLGFVAFGGDPAQNWLILKNGDHFSTVYPITELVSQKILADTGPKCSITITAAEAQSKHDEYNEGFEE